MGEVTMPRLSDTMSEGTVGRWLKKPGDQVAVGEIIAEIETDKATMELESYEAGTLQKILVNEGQTVPIGQAIAIIGDGPVDSAAPAPAPAAPAEAASAPAPAPAPAPSEAAPAVATPEAATAPAQVGDNGHDEGARVLASPVARRLAQEYDVDLRLIKGTGPGGRIIKENVEEYRQQAKSSPAAAPAAPAAQAATTPAAAPAPAAQAPAPAAPVVAGEVQPLSRMRQAIARAMMTAKPGTPHIYVTAEIDMGQAMVLRKQLNDAEAAPVKISVNDLVVKAVAKALIKFPSVNTSYTAGPDGKGGLIQHPRINVSVAVALDDGLTAPVIVDADKKSLGVIAAEIRELAGRAREGKLKQQELEGATFQVTNLGMFDVVEFGSIITTPQAASLAVGAVRQTPVVRDGQIVVGEMMFVTISADHRIVDGAIAAQFLQELKRLLQAPMSVLV